MHRLSSQRGTESCFLPARLSRGRAPVTAGWGTGAPRPGEGWRVQSPADSNELCAPSAKSRSFHAEPEAARAFAGPVLDGGKQGREPRGECRNAGGRSRGTARPALPARGLCPPTRWLPARPNSTDPALRWAWRAARNPPGTLGHRTQLLRCVLRSTFSARKSAGNFVLFF